MAIPTQIFNTAADLRTFYENSVINDYPDPQETYILFNQAKDLIEDLYKPKIFESCDVSQSAIISDTYKSMKSLPNDYRSTDKIVLTAPSGGALQLPYFPIPFKDREKYQLVSRKFYIDIKNKQFALCGKVSSTMTINHYYRIYTGQMTVATENDTDPIAWPARFWNIIAYGAAAIKQGNFDADAMAFRMSTEQQATFDALLIPFLSWDHDLKMQDMNFQGGYADGFGGDDMYLNLPYNNIGLL